MSATCIVCLGDLGDGTGDPETLERPSAKSPRPAEDPDRVTVENVKPEPNLNDDDNKNDQIKKLDRSEDADEYIAHLKPCGHNLHNECLKPWVERANSCPICRAKFTTVDLIYEVGGKQPPLSMKQLRTNIWVGHVISSYSVEDRAQVAEFDPSMLLEEVDFVDEAEPCQICKEDDNEDVLMFCDHCSKLYHTYCVDLQEVPVGHWFCDPCRAQRAVNPRAPCPPSTVRRQLQAHNGRTRGQQRRFRNREHATDVGWSNVWQGVFTRLNLDLDFPDDDEAAATAMRRHRQQTDANRQEFDAWQRRRQVAELQGGGRSRFADTQDALHDAQRVSALHAGRMPRGRTRHHPRTPEPEPAENKLAWAAYDEACEEDSQPRKTQNSGSKKRKSTAQSPSDAPIYEVIRPFKRPRSRVSDSEDVPEFVPPSRLREPVPLQLPTQSGIPLALDVISSGPSFLQSLLREVENAAAPSGARSSGYYRQSPMNAPSPGSERHSPGPSSPALSSPPSNHSSPRPSSATPPPFLGRPNSPTGLSSSIQPNYSSHDFSPLHQSPGSPSSLTNGHQSRVPPGIDLGAHRSFPNSPPLRPRSNDTSPTRQPLSSKSKHDVQKMVSTALKPHYRQNAVSKEEYTTINRDISRKLYDQIQDFEVLGVEGRAKWEKVAADEVEDAVKSLKHTSRIEQLPELEEAKAVS